MKNLEFPTGIVPTWQEKFWMHRMDLRKTCMNYEFIANWIIAALLSNFLAYKLGAFTYEPYANITIVLIISILSVVLSAFLDFDLFTIRSFPYCPNCNKIIECKINLIENSGYLKKETQLGKFYEPKPLTMIPRCLSCDNVAIWQ